MLLVKQKQYSLPSVVVAEFAPGRICNILDVENILSSGPVNCLAPALRFLLLQLCKWFKLIYQLQ